MPFLVQGWVRLLVLAQVRALDQAVARLLVRSPIRGRLVLLLAKAFRPLDATERLILVTGEALLLGSPLRQDKTTPHRLIRF